MARLRQAVGLRGLAQSVKTTAKAVKTETASLKQYRETDGRFYFKLVDAKGAVLLQSRGLDSPQVAGQSIALLKARGIDALADLLERLEPFDADHVPLRLALQALSAPNE